MRVQLVNPPPFRINDQYDAPDFPQLGLATLAGYLITKGLTDISVIDAKFERLDYDAILRRVAAYKPDIIGITAMTNEVIQAAKVASLIKERFPQITTVIGGIHVSVLPEQTLKEFPSFDIGIVGQGEISLHQLIKALEQGGDLQAVKGIVYRSDNQILQNAPRFEAVDLDFTPAWHLFPKAKTYMISSQRGCPFNCPFCVNPNGHRLNKRSIQSVIDEMTMLADDFGAAKVVFADEVFSLDRKRTIELCQAMIGAGLAKKLTWKASTHVNSVDVEVFKFMKDSGCYLIELGIESGDPDILKVMHKGVTIEKILKVRQDAKAAGIPFGALFILGHPNETLHTAWRTLNLAVRLNSDLTILGIMVPFPGTRIGEMAKCGEGGYRLIAKDWNDYGKQHGHAVEMQTLSRRQLELLQGVGYIRVLLENGRIVDLAKFIWQFRREAMALGKRLLSVDRS